MGVLFKKIIWGLQQRGIQVLVILTLYLLTASHLPLIAHQGLYTISIFIRDLLIWMLPLTVGFFIAHAICSFQSRAPLFILTIILFEAFSNLLSVWFAYGSGHIAADHLPFIKLPSSQLDFNALWRLPFTKPAWWSVDKGTLAGVFLGLLGSFSKSLLKPIIYRGKEIAQWTLTRFFARLIPLFVLGFVARMYQTHLLYNMFSHYGALLIWLIFFLSLYIAFLFFVGSNGKWKTFLVNIKNLLPAGGIAFSSGCSLSTMPWTIVGTSKNLKNPDFAQVVIPATTNIQQIGDCITNTFLCFLIYTHFFGHCPDFFTWVNFSMVFVLARFVTAAVIGGAIFIMLPIYETYLNFNAEMIAIILAFNVILDPLITSTNVVANGALCRIFEKVWLWINAALPSFLIRKSVKNSHLENLSNHEPKN